MSTSLNFRSLGPTTTKAKGKQKAFPAILIEETPGDSKALAAIVSVQAEKLVPSLKKKDFRVRITTPDGRPWDLPSFYVEDTETAERYGWGTASVLVDRQTWKDFAPWNG